MREFGTEGTYSSGTLKGVIARAACDYPEKEAVFDGTYRKTFGDIDGEAKKLAASFVSMGVLRGDVVATVLPNWYEQVVIFYAAMEVGAVFAPMNSNFTAEELACRAGISHPRIVFSHKGDHIGAAPDAVFCSVRFEADGVPSFADLIARAPSAVPECEVDPSQTALILSTSGTTGAPKQVELSHFAEPPHGRMACENLGCTSEDKFIAPAPIGGQYGMMSGMLIPFLVGGSTVLEQRFTPERALEIIQEERVTALVAVPTMLKRIISEYDFGNYDISSLRIGIAAGSAVDPALIKWFEDEAGCKMLIPYGNTEVGMVSCTRFDDSEDMRAATCGKVLPDIEMYAADADGNPFPPARQARRSLDSAIPWKMRTRR